MQLDTDKIDQAVLALLTFGRHEGYRAWKSFDWDALVACTRRPRPSLRSRSDNEIRSVMDGLTLFSRARTVDEGAS